MTSDKSSRYPSYQKLRKIRSQGPVTLEWRGDGRFISWKSSADVCLRKLFGASSPFVDRFNRISFTSSYGTSPEKLNEVFFFGISKIEQLLDEALEKLSEEAWPEEQTPEPEPVTNSTGAPDTPAQAPAEVSSVSIKASETSSTVSAAKTPGRCLLVSWGSSDKLAPVEEFVKRMGFKISLVEEIPGKNLLDVLPDLKGVHFIILQSGPEGAGEPAHQRLFELGYLAGKLGRARVCVLVPEDCAPPLEYSELCVVEFTGEWMFKMIRSFKKAGLNVDANRAFE